LLVLAVAWVFVGHSRGFDLIAVISAACLFQFFFVVDAFFQSKVRGKVTSIARSLAFLVSTVFKIFLIWIEAPLIYFAVALMLDTALVGLFHGVAFLRFSRLDFGTLRVRWETAKHLLSESWPFILSGASMAVYVKIDVVMIQWLLTEYDVGQYVGAARISEAIYFVPGAITSALYPAIVNAKQKSVDLYKSRLSNLYSFLFFASLAYAACLALLSGPIIQILLGQQYLEATSVLVLHVWASIFVFLGYANSKWLLTEGLQIYFAANTAIGAVVNVLLNLILVPLYSIEGAAIATVISYAVSAYLSMLIWPKTRENFYLLSRSMIANPLKINLNPKAA
ncbi:MAG: flippase, partial [Pseudomonadota bacterium]